jgi:hypothetical protein
MITPFTKNELANSFQMNWNASLGPDGFGPGFYRKFWGIIKKKISKLVSSILYTNIGHLKHQ